jgi:hypothetical protein
MPAPRVICELFVMHRNEITKRIQFLEDEKGYSVIEQDRVRNRFRPIGHKDEYTWNTCFFISNQSRDIVRSFLSGRLAMCGYIEGNILNEGD